MCGPSRDSTLTAGQYDTTFGQPVAVEQTSGDADSDSGNGTVYGVAGILLGLAAGLLACRRANYAN
ncbi:hypothetical protein [Micromonospora sp. WMMD1219]|uniref:hypothetical protein n=1 Tax=Micromonospora sp. WMMD1219 TaxID=3404115 RepID=UPI003BF53B4E